MIHSAKPSLNRKNEGREGNILILIFGFNCDLKGKDLQKRGRNNRGEKIPVSCQD